MVDRWMPHLRLPMTEEQFRQLPKHVCYLYGYVGGAAIVTPRARTIHACLDFRSLEGAPIVPRSDAVPIRQATPLDFEPLADLFAAAFDRVEPFASLDAVQRFEAGRTCLERTLTGGDGPWIEKASFVAAVPDGGRLAGAMLVTLLPIGDPSERDTYLWPEPAPENAIERGLGQPHATWIMTRPSHRGQRLAKGLLRRTVAALRSMGFRHLLTTILAGNESSLLWHWGAGFRLSPPRRRDVGA